MHKHHTWEVAGSLLCSLSVRSSEIIKWKGQGAKKEIGPSSDHGYQGEGRREKRWSEKKQQIKIQTCQSNTSTCSRFPLGQTDQSQILVYADQISNAPLFSHIHNEKNLPAQTVFACKFLGPFVGMFNHGFDHWLDHWFDHRLDSP